MRSTFKPRSSVKLKKKNDFVTSIIISVLTGRCCSAHFGHRQRRGHRHHQHYASFSLRLHRLGIVQSIIDLFAVFFRSCFFLWLRSPECSVRRPHFLPFISQISFMVESHIDKFIFYRRAQRMYLWPTCTVSQVCGRRTTRTAALNVLVARSRYNCE